MIGHLNEKIRKLVLLLLIAIFACLVAAAHVLLYYGALRSAKEELRDLSKEVGLKQMIDPGYAGDELEWLPFAAVQVPRKEDANFEPVVWVNQIPGISDETLLAYVGDIPAKAKENVRLPKLIYIIKRKDNVGKVILFLPKSEALRRLLPLMAAGIVMEAAVVLLLLYVSKRISRLLVKPVEDMVRAEKKFISNASHELKTPLTVIMANADYLEAVMGQEKHLGYIREEVVRMNHLIMEMLTLARLDSVEEFYNKTEFLLDEAVLEVAYPFESVAFEKSLKLTIDVQENMKFTGEPQQLGKVVSVLLDNALSYCAEQGEVSVKAFKKTGAYVLEVADTGKEIPKEVQKNLFERFYRQDEQRTEEGSHFGLGLSIAYEIVKKHRGTIAVSTGGGWNTFTVTLPYEAAR